MECGDAFIKLPLFRSVQTNGIQIPIPEEEHLPVTLQMAGVGEHTGDLSLSRIPPVEEGEIAEQADVENDPQGKQRAQAQEDSFCCFARCHDGTAYCTRSGAPGWSFAERAWDLLWTPSRKERSMMKLVECVPNFSEGRNRAVIDRTEIVTPSNVSAVKVSDAWRWAHPSAYHSLSIS